MDRYKAVVGVFTGLLVAGCAGSASHEVVSPYQVSDGDLSCNQIESEMMEAQVIIDGVNPSKRAVLFFALDEETLFVARSISPSEVNLQLIFGGGCP